MTSKEYLEIQTLCMRMHAYIKQKRYKEADAVLYQMHQCKSIDELTFYTDVVEELRYMAECSIQMN